MKYFSETSASNLHISIHSDPFFKHGRFGECVKKTKIMKTFYFIFILIMVVHISMSSSYYQRDMNLKKMTFPILKNTLGIEILWGYDQECGPVKRKSVLDDLWIMTTSEKNLANTKGITGWHSIYNCSNI